MPIFDYRETGCNIHNSAIMASPIGCVSEFDNSKETWCTYIERLESFFNVNDIAEGKKSDFLVSVMGSETYGLLKNLMAHTNPSTKPFSELVKTLGDHLDSQPTEMGERFRFGRRIQNGGESVASFVAELRRLSLHCGYGENLSTSLRDQFVLGLYSEATQKKLVMIKDLKLDLAIQTAKMDETATRDTGELHGHPSGAGACASTSTRFIPVRRKTDECEIRERTPTGVIGAMEEVTLQMTVDSRMNHFIGVANSVT